jgi:ABC-type sugar transport system ATPase subunit
LGGLRLDRASKWFGDTPALDSVSLEVAPGEFVVVVGPSGSGKTTMLRSIAGLERLDSGDIYLDGVLANEIPVGKRNVQMIFQSLALWPHMSVMDDKAYTNLSLPLKIRNWTVDQIRDRVSEVGRRVGLDQRLHARRPQELSGGQQQRVALARALTTMPGTYLMDEPMAHLDPPTRVKLRQEIRDIHVEVGATTIYVTHNMADAFAMADRVVMMSDGRIVQVGTVNQLREHPVNQWVTDFLNSS